MDQEMIILPPRGIRIEGHSTNEAVRSFLTSFPPVTGESTRAVRSFSVRRGSRLDVLDTIGENGAKLVRVSQETLATLRVQSPGLRIVPVTYFKTATVARPSLAARTASARRSVGLTIRLVSSSGGAPVPNAHVIAFTDFAQGVGDEGNTNANGDVTLRLSSGTKIQRLYIYPALGFWGGLLKNVTLTANTPIKLRPIDLSFTDALRHFHGNGTPAHGAGVTVGVVDTGVGPHPDLTVAGGVNTVYGENPNDYGDNGAQHGTHVGGIIAAAGTPPTGIRGVAPGVTLRSYRVFGKDAETATNFAIAKAIDRAVLDGCDLINLSLGGGAPDPATADAIADARSAGTVCVIANGNDGRQPVSFPASEPFAVAVSALGRKKTFPSGTIDSENVVPPFGVDPLDFIAAFSNIGPQTALTGPGVGILSTVPGGYAAMSGTSMACPAVTGMAARLLAGNPALLAATRDSTRADSIKRLILQSARTMGFSRTFEGQGML